MPRVQLRQLESAKHACESNLSAVDNAVFAKTTVSSLGAKPEGHAKGVVFVQGVDAMSNELGSCEVFDLNTTRWAVRCSSCRWSHTLKHATQLRAWVCCLHQCMASLMQHV